MDENVLKARIKSANDEMVTEVEDENIVVPQAPKPKDTYQERRRQRQQSKGVGQYGTRPYTKHILKYLRQSPLIIEYKKAKDTSDRLAKVGDTERAAMVREQYMEDYYFPTVDAAVRLGSKADVLSSKEILDSLDALAFLPNGLPAKGFSASFVASLYEDNNAPAQSDKRVLKTIVKIKENAAVGNISQAIAMAKDIKDAIDRGENVAIPEDYEIIQRMVIRAD